MSKEKQIEEMAKVLTKYEKGLCERLPKDKCLLTSAIHAQVSCDYCKIAEFLYNAGYRKQSENVIELPCKVGDLVHFKGLETPWKVSAIHIYEEGQPQISITSETGKITSTMTANEFHMFCFVLTETEAKMKGGGE